MRKYLVLQEIVSFNRVAEELSTVFKLRRKWQRQYTFLIWRDDLEMDLRNEPNASRPNQHLLATAYFCCLQPPAIGDRFCSQQFHMLKIDGNIFTETPVWLANRKHKKIVTNFPDFQFLKQLNLAAAIVLQIGPRPIFFHQLQASFSVILNVQQNCSQSIEYFQLFCLETWRNTGRCYIRETEEPHLTRAHIISRYSALLSQGQATQRQVSACACGSFFSLKSLPLIQLIPFNYLQWGV